MCANYLGVSQVAAIRTDSTEPLMTIPFLAVSRWCRHGEIGHLSNAQTAITEPWGLAKLMTGNLEDGDLGRLCQHELAYQRCAQVAPAPAPIRNCPACSLHTTMACAFPPVRPAWSTTWKPRAPSPSSRSRANPSLILPLPCSKPSSSTLFVRPQTLPLSSIFLPSLGYIDNITRVLQDIALDL